MGTVNRQGTASRKSIAAAWCFYLVDIGRFESTAEVLSTEACFACGTYRGTDRAHIEPAVEGAPNSADNLNLLCWVCHKSSEYLEGRAYMDWLESRMPTDAYVEALARGTGGLTESRYFAAQALSLSASDALNVARVYRALGSTDG